MRVTFMKLANVRTIEAAAFRFRPGVNLVVGVNGVGKTTVLDALGVCFSAYVKQANKPQDEFREPCRDTFAGTKKSLRNALD